MPMRSSNSKKNVADFWDTTNRISPLGSRVADMADSKEEDREDVVLVDEQGRPVGVEEKFAAHRDGGRLHLAFSVYVFNAKGELLLQRRAPGKYHFAGLWSNSCCGHFRFHAEVPEAPIFHSQNDARGSDRRSGPEARVRRMRSNYSGWTASLRSSRNPASPATQISPIKPADTRHQRHHASMTAASRYVR